MMSLDQARKWLGIVALIPIVAGAIIGYPALPLALGTLALLAIYHLGVLAGAPTPPGENSRGHPGTALQLVLCVLLALLLSGALVGISSVVMRHVASQRSSLLGPLATIEAMERGIVSSKAANGPPSDGIFLRYWRPAPPLPLRDLVPYTWTAMARDERGTTFEAASFLWGCGNDPMFRLPVTACLLLVISGAMLGTIALVGRVLVRGNRVGRSLCPCSLRASARCVFWTCFFGVLSVEGVYADSASVIATMGAAATMLAIFELGRATSMHLPTEAAPCPGSSASWRLAGAGVLACVMLEVLLSLSEREFLIVPAGLLIVLVLRAEGNSTPTIRIGRHWPVLVPLAYLIGRCWLSRHLIANNWFFVRGTLCEHTTACLVYAAAAAVLLCPPLRPRHGRRLPTLAWLILGALLLFAVSISIYRLPYYLLIGLTAYYVGLTTVSAVRPLRYAWRVIWIVPVAVIFDYLSKVPWASLNLGPGAVSLLASIRPVEIVLLGGGPVPVGVWFELFLPVAWVMARAPGTSRDRLFAWAVFALAVAALGATQTRGAWAGALVAAIIMALSSARRQGQHWRAVAIGLGGVVLLAGTALAFRRLESGALAYRLGLIPFAWSVFLHHPWFGVGVFGFREAVQPHAAALGYSIVPTHSHNQYLELLVSHGLIGCAILAVGVCYALRGLLHRSSSLQQQDQALVVALLAGVAGTSVHGLLDVPWVFPELLSLAAALAGLLLGAARGNTLTQPQIPLEQS